MSKHKEKHDVDAAAQDNSIDESGAESQVKESNWDRLKKATAKAAMHATGDKPEASAESKAIAELTRLDKEDLIQQLLDAQKTAKEHWEKVLRSEAHVSNIQRRAEKDIASAHKYSIDRFAKDLIPIVDSFELSLQAINGNDDLIAGIELTLKMLLSSLEKHGVTQTNPLHELFNPDLHEAIAMQENAEHKPGTILSVMQKGYLLHGRLMRPAMVIVSKAVV